MRLMAAPGSPSEIARETIRRLAQRRLVPTPESYASVYREIAGTAPAAEAPGPEREFQQFLREQLAKLLTDAVVPRLGYGEDLAGEASAIAAGLRSASTLAEARDQAAALRQFWIHLELRGETQADLVHSALALLQLVVRNFGEIAVEDRWLKPQLEKIEALLASPPDLKRMREAERGLREVIFRQGSLKRGLLEAKAALKNMVGVFLDRLGALGSATGEYSARMDDYSRRIQEADDLRSLAELVAQLMADTRGVQADIVRSRDELLEARRQAQQYEARVEKLEKELETVAGLVREDALTGALNRRGLEEAFAAETARGERRGSALSLAVLDIDNFKQLNDRLGHQAGDAALAHLAQIVRGAVRPSDVVARFGGEEFVILLPDTGCEEAVNVMVRVQRELTRRFFLHNNEKVLITFSAGVAERVDGEAREQLIERADRAMYAAKRSGKNRVFAAQTLPA
jgi:diguanylate cyclase